jgi:ribose 5-phosphate isomerase B
MSQKSIALGCDHAGFEYKQMVMEKLVDAGYDVSDFGTHSTDSVDYPDFVHPVAEAIGSGKCEVGFLFCGSANGVAITANKHQHIRAAIAWRSDVAALARQHNDANILCIPARFVSPKDAASFVDVFLSTPFEGGRHAQRVGKIASMRNGTI